MSNFTSLCDRAFTPHKTGSLAPLHHGGRYKTSHLANALQESFSDVCLFGPTQIRTEYVNHVACCATTEAWERAVVIGNYNRSFEGSSSYNFERPELPSQEMKLWEVARANSAAPGHFKPFVNHRTRKGYLDGAIYHKNPVEIANHERKLLWPDTAEMHPDILLSVGTGLSGEPDEDERSSTLIESPSTRRGFNMAISRPRDGTYTLPSRPSRWRLGQSIKGIHTCLDNVMNAEETWEDFRKHVTGM